MLDLEFVIYTVHNVQSMSCCSVHNVYHKPTLCESLARAKILQSECKYPETKKSSRKTPSCFVKIHVNCNLSSLASHKLRQTRRICTIGHRPAKNVSCYVPVDICTIVVPETMRDYGGSEYLR